MYHGLPGAGKNHYRDGSHKQKMLNVADEAKKRLFFKEVALLNSIKYHSVVKSMAVCNQPLAMMLEYVYFDFHLFGQAVRVNTLSEFLLKIDEENCSGFHDLVCHAATKVIDGMSYLHNQRIAHRGLKTAIILVSNQHYSSLSLEDEEFGPTYQARPIACKLTDFGEIRSHFIQTLAIIASETTNIDRGTMVYMSPELLLKEKLVPCASIVWAFGMIVFTMINPSLK